MYLNVSVGPADRLEHFLVVLNAEGTHEENHGDCGCSSCADLDHEHTVTALLDVEGLAHTVFSARKSWRLRFALRNAC